MIIKTEAYEKEYKLNDKEEATISVLLDYILTKMVDDDLDDITNAMFRDVDFSQIASLISQITRN